MTATYSDLQSTATYSDLQSQIQALKDKEAILQKQLEQVCSEERAPAIAQVKGLISQYDIKQSEIFPKKEKFADPAEPQTTRKWYRDPETNEIWKGVGNRTRGLKGKKNIEAYRILDEATEPMNQSLESSEYPEPARASESTPPSSEPRDSSCHRPDSHLGNSIHAR